MVLLRSVPQTCEMGKSPGKCRGSAPAGLGVSCHLGKRCAGCRGGLPQS